MPYELLTKLLLIELKVFSQPYAYKYFNGIESIILFFSHEMKYL